MHGTCIIKNEYKRENDSVLENILDLADSLESLYKVLFRNHNSGKGRNIYRVAWNEKVFSSIAIKLGVFLQTYKEIPL